MFVLGTSANSAIFGPGAPRPSLAARSVVGTAAVVGAAHDVRVCGREAADHPRRRRRYARAGPVTSALRRSLTAERPASERVNEKNN